MASDRSFDPAKNWIYNSPNAETFIIGNLVPIEERSNIPIQRAEAVFPDRKGYLILQIYGSLFEMEFNKITMNEL